MKFFRIYADSSDSSRWYLRAPINSEGNEVDPRKFTKCVKYNENYDLRIPLRRKGKAVNFNFCDFDMVVVESRIAEGLGRITDGRVQIIPLEVEGNGREFGILNVLDSVSCIDEARSEFVKWTEADGRPDKIGKYRMITQLRINAVDSNRYHIFRLREWPIALIVSEDVKILLEDMKVTGIVFEAVS